MATGWQLLGVESHTPTKLHGMEEFFAAMTRAYERGDTGIGFTQILNRECFMPVSPHPIYILVLDIDSAI